MVPFFAVPTANLRIQFGSPAVLESLVANALAQRRHVAQAVLEEFLVSVHARSIWVFQRNILSTGHNELASRFPQTFFLSILARSLQYCKCFGCIACSVKLHIQSL